MLVSGAPDMEIQTLKSFKKVTWKPARTKNMYFDPRSPKSYQNGVPKSRQNQKTPSMDPKISFLMLRSTPVDRLMVPQGAKWRQKAYQMMGFGHQTLQIQTPKSSKVDTELSRIPTSVENSFLQPCSCHAAATQSTQLPCSCHAASMQLPY